MTMSRRFHDDLTATVAFQWFDRKLILFYGGTLNTLLL